MNGRLWEHPIIQQRHIIRMTRDYPDGFPQSVASCQCGWTSTKPATAYPDQDEAIKAHWQGAIDGSS